MIRDLEKSLRGNPNTDACKAISTALLHEAAGNTAAAVSELNAAVQAVRGSTALSSNLKIGLARSCLTNKLDKEASEVMLSVMNDVGSGVSMQQAMSVFVKAGRPDLADGMGVQLKAQAQGLLDVAAEKTNMGDFKGAVQTLLEARHVSPGNLQVMIALVLAESCARSASWAGIIRWPSNASARSPPSASSTRRIRRWRCSTKNTIRPSASTVFPPD